MKYEYRTARPEERADVIDLANQVFSMAHRPHDFPALIPKVYGEGRGYTEIHKIAVDTNGRIRAIIAALRGEMHAGGEILKTGYVGTVSVHPYFRGEGHMIHLMEETDKALREEGCDLALLSGQRQRYEYYGFTQGGMQIVHSVGRSNVRHALKNVDVDGIEISSVDKNDAETIKKAVELYNKRLIHAKRTEEDFFVIAHTWYSDLKKITLDGAFIGYAIDSGAEGSKEISELCLTDIKYLDMFIKKYVTDAASAVRLVTSPADTAVNARLSEYEEEAYLTHTQHLRVYSFAKVISALLTLKARIAPMNDGRVSFIIDGQPVTVEVKAGEVIVTEKADEGAEELTAMGAQHIFFDQYDYAHRLPLGWAPLPVYVDKVDEF